MKQKEINSINWIAARIISEKNKHYFLGDEVWINLAAKKIMSDFEKIKNSDGVKKCNKKQESPSLGE